MKMEKHKRYRFVDGGGIQKGIRDTDSLLEAIQSAMDSECEVIDTQTSSGNQIVFSAWDGWNVDYDFYNKDIADFIMAEIEAMKKKQERKDDMSLNHEIHEEITMEMIEILWGAACSGDVNTLKQYYESKLSLKNVRYLKLGKEISLIMGAYRNNQWKTIDYLISVGETITEEEKEDIQRELNRIKYMEILARK